MLLMTKRNLGIFGIILIFVAVIIAVFWNLYRHQSFSAEKTLDAVPLNSPLILRINSAEDFVETLQNKINYKSDLQAFESISKFFDLINYIDTTSLFSGSAFKDLLKAPIYVSVNKIGKNSFEWAMHFAIQNQAHLNDLKSWITNRHSEKRIYTGFSIFKISIPANNINPLFVTWQNGVLTVSPSSLIVEASIRQQQTGHSLRTNPQFSNLNKTTNPGSIASLFFNFSLLPGFSEPFLAPKAKNNALFFGRISSWGALDLQLNKERLTLNGFLSNKDTSKFSSLFEGVKPRKSSLHQVLPSDIKLFFSYNYDDPLRFIENLKRYIQNSDEAKKFETVNQSYKNATGSHFVDAFFNLVEGEAALAFSNYNASNPKEGRFLVFRTKGQASTLSELKQMQKYFGVSTDPITWYKVDESTTFPIYQGFSEELPKVALGYLFPDTPLQYFSFYRNYLIFGDSQKSLESFLYQNILKRTLQSHPYFSSFMENFAYEENLFLFAEIPHLISFLQPSLNPDYFHPTQEQMKILFNFYGAGIQLSNSSGLHYVTACADYTPHRDKEPRTIWQSRLDSAVAIKPALVVNHYTREKEIMVQDKLNNLYLINNMGRILWEKPLDGPIISEIHQIDYYQNNKLQYLFNTEKKLYLLDRNGNHVARYPFTLPAKATNGVAVFDYDKNRNYRLFLALEDRQIYLFDKTGARVTGWNIPQTEGIVTQPVQFFRTSGKDYIVFSDQYRNYIMDRRGNTRVRPNKIFIRNNLSPFYLEYPNSEKSALVTTTTDGSLAQILLPSGETIIRPQTKVENQPHYFAILYDNKPKYVIVTAEQLKIYNNNLHPEVNKKLESPVKVIADIYHFSSTDYKIGLVSEKESKIFLYNSDGTLYKGFPLKGTSRFSIGFLKSSAYRFNLITGGDYNFIYNYRVE